MASWDEVTKAAPEIAALARGRIEATGLGFLATLRRDGFPRVSGIEPFFIAGELWLGMMKESLKSRDLQRDGRCCLHNASTDKEVKDGDVKITGIGVLVDDMEAKEALRQAVKASSGHDVGTDYDLFRLDVKEIATIRPGDDHLVIGTWREGEVPKRVLRR